MSLEQRTQHASASFVSAQIVMGPMILRATQIYRHRSVMPQMYFSSAMWHLTFALGWIENHTFFVQIIYWTPCISQVQSTGHPSIFLAAMPWKQKGLALLGKYQLLQQYAYEMKPQMHVLVENILDRDGEIFSMSHWRFLSCCASSIMH